MPNLQWDLHYIPSNADRLYINKLMQHGRWRFTCVRIPPGKYVAKVPRRLSSTKKIIIKHDYLYVGMWRGNGSNTVGIVCANSNNEDLLPYRLANHTDFACFGHEEPRDLRQAWQYWVNQEFNFDLGGYLDSYYARLLFIPQWFKSLFRKDVIKAKSVHSWLKKHCRYSNSMADQLSSRNLKRIELCDALIRVTGQGVGRSAGSNRHQVLARAWKEGDSIYCDPIDEGLHKFILNTKTRRTKRI